MQAWGFGHLLPTTTRLSSPAIRHPPWLPRNYWAPPSSLCFSTDVRMSEKNLLAAAMASAILSFVGRRPRAIISTRLKPFVGLRPNVLSRWRSIKTSLGWEAGIADRLCLFHFSTGLAFTSLFLDSRRFAGGRCSLTCGDAGLSRFKHPHGGPF